MHRPTRTKSGSPNSSRRRDSAWLAAGWPTPSRAAAPVTLPSAISASRARRGVQIEARRIEIIHALH
jgi:hypothetical protein